MANQMIKMCVINCGNGNNKSSAQEAECHAVIIPFLKSEHFPFDLITLQETDDGPRKATSLLKKLAKNGKGEQIYTILPNENPTPAITAIAYKTGMTTCGDTFPKHDFEASTFLLFNFGSLEYLEYLDKNITVFR